MNVNVRLLAAQVLLLLFFFSYFQTTSYAQVPTQGLVAYYPFNDNANDESGQNYHGTAMGAVLDTNRLGLVNRAYHFDGMEDYIDYGDILDSLTMPFSVSAWIYDDTATSFSGILRSDDNPSDAGNYYGFWLVLNDTNSVGINFGNGSSAGHRGRRSKVSEITVPERVWTHVTATVESDSNIVIYINGQDAGGVYSGSADTMLHTAWPMKIGVSTRWGPNFFKGAIDDVLLYSRAISQEEVQTIFQDTLSTRISNRFGQFDPGIVVAYDQARADFIVRLSHARSELADISLIDMTGKTIFMQPGIRMQDDGFRIEGTPLSPGVYALRVRMGGNVFTRKVMKW